MLPQWLKERLAHVVDYAVYLLVRIIVATIQATTPERCDRWAKMLAKLLDRFAGLRQRLIHQNLARVFPSWKPRRANAVALAMWHHLLLMVCEIAHAPRKIHRTNWYDYYHIEDRRMILKFIFDVRPKIFVTGHFGNFELAGYLTGLFGFPSTTIARPLDNRYLHDFIMRFRSMGGQHFIAKDKSAHLIQALLETGGTLSLLADQDAGTKGCWVNFLGSPASCHKALAVFTLSNQAPMLVCFNRRKRGAFHFEVVVTGIADPLKPAPYLESVQSLTQWYNDRLEQGIRETPEQYWWVHNRWRDPPARLRRQSESQQLKQTA